MKNFILIFIIWILFFIFPNPLPYAIHESNGLFSIISGTFLHGNLKHLLNNTVGLLAIIPIVRYLYPKDALELVILGLIFPSALTYVTVDIPVVGISGLLFCLNWFVIVAGLNSKNVLKMIVSLFVLVFFGSLLSATPYAPLGVAWQTHLYGLIIGVLWALINPNRNKKPSLFGRKGMFDF